MVMQLTPGEHERVSQAIRQAELTTSGEIFCVIARQVSAWRQVSLAWATGAAFLLPLALIPFGFSPAWPPGLSDGWTVAHIAAEPSNIGLALGAYTALQAVIFLIVFLLTSFDPIRRWVTPRSMRASRARRAALEQFLAHGLHTTQERTGVLIFAAVAERQVEIVADEGIHSRVPEDVWADAVAALAADIHAGHPGEGFVKAVTSCGHILAQHFPPGSENPNERPDRLVVI